MQGIPNTSVLIIKPVKGDLIFVGSLKASELIEKGNDIKKSGKYGKQEVLAAALFDLDERRPSKTFTVSTETPSK
jgi:hypothetical protein